MGDTHINFKLDVTFEERFFGAHAYRCAKQLACGREIESTNLEARVHEPKLRKRELLMRHERDGSLVNLTRALVVLKGIEISTLPRKEAMVCRIRTCVSSSSKSA
jgi:hypothetical protein